MPVLDKNTVKTWFASRAKPFAAQFAQWIDACWFKGEMIPVSNISGIDAYLGGALPGVSLELVAGFNEAYQVPMGYAIFMMYITPTADESITIANALTADPYVEGLELLAGIAKAIQIDVISQVGTSINFDGFTAPATATIYLHKL